MVLCLVHPNTKVLNKMMICCSFDDDNYEVTCFSSFRNKYYRFAVFFGDKLNILMTSYQAGQEVKQALKPGVPLSSNSLGRWEGGGCNEEFFQGRGGVASSLLKCSYHQGLFKKIKLTENSQLFRVLEPILGQKLTYFFQIFSPKTEFTPLPLQSESGE